MNTAARELLDSIAELLRYPGVDLVDKVLRARRVSESLAFEAVDDRATATTLAAAAGGLADYLERSGKSAAEERFTLLFDLSPVCTLNIGYHLFGDAYGRGELLAGLVGEMQSRGIPIEDEIPDHLPLLLQLLARTEDRDDRRILLAMVLRPGLVKIQEALKQSMAPWSDLVRALTPTLECLVPDAGPSPEISANMERYVPPGSQEVPARA